MAVAKTLRKYEIKPDESGLIGIPVDVCRADGNVLEQIPFYLSTAAVGCEMRAADLKALGYDVSAPVVSTSADSASADSAPVDSAPVASASVVSAPVASAPVVLPFIRIGIYDFFNISVEVSDANIIGAGLLKWLNFSISNSESMFDVDLIDRLKPLVEKGVNPNIKSSALSRIKSSRYNDDKNWFAWEEIDTRYPNSWILLSESEENETDPGGEILWHSETEIPEVSQNNTLLYCNKSIADKKPFLVQLEDYVRCRGVSKPDQAFSVFVEELEAKLAPPRINRFYYDTVSKQGKLYVMRKTSVAASDKYIDPNAVLTQEAIDELFLEYGVE